MIEPGGVSSACPGCGHENRDAARFCEECGSALDQRCASCGTELRAGAKFCDGCGKPVGGGAPPQAAQEARKTVTIVFTDLAGSTSLQEQLDPESVKRVMARHYEVLREAIESFGGRVVKFTGDGVMAVFGSPVVREDDALRAVRAAARMVASLAELNVELDRDWGVGLRMRTGVNTGEVVAARDGGDLVGDPVNVAARLEQAAGEGQVLVGPETARLVRHDVQLEAVAPLELKGKREPMPAFLLVAVDAPPGEVRIEAPLVGRDDELARLRRAFEDAEATRRCRLATVVGSPGIGKTRLVHELAAALDGRATVVQGHCEASGEGATLLPIAGVLRDAARIGESDEPETVREKLGALLPEDGEHERTLDRLAAVLGLGLQAPPEETFWAVRRLLEAVARQSPLLVVLDDVHWGESTFLDLVEHLVEWVRDAPVLIVALARPELRESREALTSSRRAFDVVHLEPLGAEESRELAGQLLDSAALPPELAVRVLDATEGNPLFLGEMLRMLADDGVLRRDGDAWVATGDASTVEVPPSIQALLAARIERLTDDERSVVERAAVVGRQFYRGAVAELASNPVRSRIDSHLETLRRKELVEPEGIYWIDEPVFRFHHVLIRDAAYRSLLKEARAELHERFADWLEAKAGELVGEYEEIVAFHLEQAHEYRRQLGRLDEYGAELGRRAAARLHSAGLRALGREDLPAAANLLGRAVDRMGADGEERAAALAALAETQLSAGDAQAAAATVDALSQLAGGDGRLGALAAVYATQLSNLTSSANLEERVAKVTEAAEALGGASDPAGEAKAHHVRAQTLALLGRVGEVEAALDQALAAARRAGDERRARAVLAGAPRAALWGPSPVPRASGRCLDVVRILRMSSGGRHVEAAALRCQAVLEAMRRRPDAARDILARCRATAEELGLGLELCETGVHAGVVELIAGDAAAAELELRAAYAGFAELGAESSAANAAALLARALIAKGELDEADRLTQESEGAAGDDLKTTVAWCAARAEVLARRGEPEAAEELARRAVAIAERTDALVDHADARLTLAAVLREAGREQEAIAEAGRAAELYRSKQSAAGVDRAEAFGVPVQAAEPAEPPRAFPPGALAGPQGERPPVRVTHGLAEAVNRRDWQGAAELLTDDFVNHDRRTGSPMERTADGARFIDRMRSMAATAADVRGSIDRVIAAVGDTMICDYAWRGHWDDGGASFELPMRLVSVRLGGCLERLELFDPDGDAAVTRYQELAREHATGPVWELVSDWFRAWERRDLDAIDALFRDDFVRVDHSQHRWAEMNREETLEQYRSILEGAPDARFEWVPIDEMGDVYVVRNDMIGGGSASDPVVGEWRVSTLAVGMVRDGHFARFEYFDIEDAERARSRMHELTAPPAAIRRLADGDLAGPSLSSAVWELVERFYAAHEARDWEAAHALVADDCMVVDRSLLRWPEMTGAQWLEEHRKIAADVPDVAESFEPVAEQGDAVLWRFTGKATSKVLKHETDVEYAGLTVAVATDGRLSRIELFDLEDEPGAQARMAGLAGEARGPGWDGVGSVEVGHRWAELYARQDFAGLAELLRDDVVFVEHRLGLGAGEELRGRDGVLERFRQELALAPDLRIRLSQILAATEAVVLAVNRGSGRLAEGGGEAEFEYLLVGEQQGGRVLRAELFDLEARDEAVARFEELAARAPGQGPLTVGERWRQKHNARDWHGVAALYHPGTRVTDRRRLGWGEIAGPDAVLQQVKALIELAPDNVIEPYECIALGSQTALVVHRANGHQRDGGAYEMAFLMVSSIRDGRIEEFEFFDPEERQGALDRFRELETQAPCWQVVTQWFDAFNRGDWDAFAALNAHDARYVDHSSLRWPELGAAEALVNYRNIKEVSPDYLLGVEPVADAGDACLFRWSGRGSTAGELAGTETDVEHGGLTVMAVRECRLARMEMFDAEDEQRAEDRMRELAEGTASGLVGRWTAALNDRNWGALRALAADDFVMADHRPASLGVVEGIEPYIEYQQAAVASSRDARWDAAIEMEPEGLAAGRLTVSGTLNEGGGEWANELLVLAVRDGESFARFELFPEEDRPAMLRRLEELAGGDGEPPSMGLMRRFWDLVNVREWGAAEGMLSPDYRIVDHRPVGWGSLTGNREVVAMIRGLAELAPDLRAGIDGVLAADDAVCAYRHTSTGTDEHGGAFEIAFIAVGRWENGIAVCGEIFPPDDEAAALACFERLRGRPEPDITLRAVRGLLQWLAYYNAHQWDRIDELYTEDFRLVDRRKVGWGELDYAELKARWQGLTELAPDFHHRLDAILAASDHVVAARTTVCGHDESGGRFEMPIIHVHAGRATPGEARVERTEFFDVEDEADALACFERLRAERNRDVTGRSRPG